MLLVKLSILMMNGSALTDANSDSRLSDVVEAFTLLPVITKCSVKGSPSQPLPNMLIVLIVIPLLLHTSLQGLSKFNRVFLKNGDLTPFITTK